MKNEKLADAFARALYKAYLHHRLGTNSKRADAVGFLIKF